MSKPIAPKAGYDTTIKANYREQVWDAFAPGVADIIGDTTGTLKAVIMPSAEGLEIEVALARGLREEQIVCVDRSAAVIATSKWRKRWPDVKFFASEVSAVGGKIAKAGWVVRVANLDLCGNFSDDTIDAVRGFLSGAPLAAIFSIAITMAKGREGTALVSLLKKIGARLDLECPRMASLWEMVKDEPAIGPHMNIVAAGGYISGRVPMSWAALECTGYKAAHRALRDAIRETSDKIDCCGRDGFDPALFFDIGRRLKELGIDYRTPEDSHPRENYDRWEALGYRDPPGLPEGPAAFQGSRDLFWESIRAAHRSAKGHCYLCDRAAPDHVYPSGLRICDANHCGREGCANYVQAKKERYCSKCRSNFAREPRLYAFNKSKIVIPTYVAAHSLGAENMKLHRFTLEREHKWGRKDDLSLPDDWGWAS